MSPPVNIAHESYFPNISLRFKEERNYDFKENEYNPNILNNKPYIFVNNDGHEKIQKYIEEFQSVYEKLFSLSKKYGLGSILIEEDYEKIYNQIFIISIPDGYDYDKALDVWDKIIDELELYCILNNHEQFYKDILVLLK